MAKYKVGDKVRVREDLEYGKTYYMENGRCWCPYVVNSEMHKLRGQVVTITEALPYAYGVTGFDEHWFTDEMFEGLVEEKKVFTKSDLQNGDMVLRANGVVEVFVSNPGVFVGINGFMPLHKVNSDLTHTGRGHGWDIVAVRRPEHDHDCQFTAFKAELGELVYDRERDIKKLYNGKVVCINLNGTNKHLYTVGKIYQFVDGSFVADNGEEVKTWYHPFESFEEWTKCSASKFIEIKE